jgi:hypothetical protein
MITEIGTSLSSMIIKKIIGDTLPKLDIKYVFRKGIHINKDNQSHLNNRISKACLLLPIARFYELPHFETENPIMNKELVNSYLDVAIKLVSEFDLGDKNLFKYHARNFMAPNVQNKDQLLGYLLREREYPIHNEARYRLGFRSIYVLLYDNIDKIDTFFISNINSILEPFFKSYRHKELFIPGLALN